MGKKHRIISFQIYGLYLVGCALFFTVTACSSSQRKLSGIWHTEFEAVPGLKSDLDFELRYDIFEDKWSGRFEVVESMIESELAEVKINDSKIALNLGEGAKLEGVLSADGSVITAKLFVPGREPDTLRFTKTEKWSSQRPARVDQNKQYIGTWNYSTPHSTADGWKVGPIRKATAESGPLKMILSDILQGKYNGLDAFLVAQDGQLVLEEYFYLGGRDKIHSLQSVTKSVTSLLVGIAQDKGLIRSLDTPLRDFFPAFKDTALVSPSLRHALTMSAALDWQEDIPYSDPKNDAVLMNQSSDMYQYVLSKKPDTKNKPGEIFEYNSGLSILLGGVLLNATGKPADKFAAQTLFKDLGIEKFWWNSMNEKVHTGGGLFLRPRDLLKIGQLVLDQGKWNNKQVVSTSWISASTAFLLPINGSNKDFGYGYQWWRGIFREKEKAFPAIYASGYGGQFLYIIPDLNLVILTLHHNAADATGSHTITWPKVEKMILPAFSEDK